MNQTICILGRQPDLGLAELESRFGANALQPIGQQAALLDVDPAHVRLESLGGTLKTAKLLTYVQSTELPAITKYISDTLPKHFSYIPAGKITIGISYYGYGFNTGKINAAGLGLKKNLKSSNRSVRIVPNKQPELNTAQIIHNQLTGKNGIELLCIKIGKRTALAQTVSVQDIDAYAARDQARPMRDARVGMLPPKLAQIIINLAIDSEDGRWNLEDGKKPILLDPFCGTGVILQEALLLGYEAQGTDLEPRMVDYSTKNLEWLKTQHTFPGTFQCAVGDATNHQWSAFDVIACETYLGRPFSHEPKPEVLAEVMRDVDVIHTKFLKNVAAQTSSGFKMCIAVPAWKTKTGFKHLKTLDSLEELGYTRMSFVHAKADKLIYHRDNQIVGRELVILKRI